MTKKRQFGAIRQLPSGSWQVRFRDPAGDRRAAPITFVTKAEAGRWLSGRETELFRGEWIDPTLGDITVAEWSARWLDSRPALKPKTRASYESLLRSRIVPAFGGRALSSIRPLEVQEWVAGLQKQKLSASRIRQATHLLGSFMKAAVNEGLIATNPCAIVRLPRIPDSDIEFLTAHEVGQLAAVIQQPYGALVHLLAYGGLRIGEATALRRGRCDLDRGRITVRESLADVSGSLGFGTTKTHQARNVVLPSFLVEELRNHLATASPPDLTRSSSPRPPANRSATAISTDGSGGQQRKRLAGPTSASTSYGTPAPASSSPKAHRSRRSSSSSATAAPSSPSIATATCIRTRSQRSHLASTTPLRRPSRPAMSTGTLSDALTVVRRPMGHGWGTPRRRATTRTSSAKAATSSFHLSSSRSSGDRASVS